jgi:uncharacterized protein YeaO (DUF488 family)
VEQPDDGRPPRRLDAHGCGHVPAAAEVRVGDEKAVQLRLVGEAAPCRGDVVEAGDGEDVVAQLLHDAARIVDPLPRRRLRPRRRRGRAATGGDERDDDQWRGSQEHRATIILQMRRLATIGIYDATLERFLDALHEANVGLVVDVRQRRGVRGREYAWANAQRLQAALLHDGIAYSHHKELAPTTELRRLQYAEDAKRGVGKRSRRVLAPEFAERYTREILDRADLRPLIDQMPRDTATALLCVERDPEACHRSLAAAALARELNADVQHLYL